MTDFTLSKLLAIVDEARDECVGQRGDHDDYVAGRALAALSFSLRTAIATEAGTAETENTGSVHEGAGRNAALTETKAVDPYALGGGK